MALKLNRPNIDESQQPATNAPFIVILVQRVSGARFILCRFIQLFQNPLHHVIRLFYPINQVKTLRSLIQRDKPELTKRILRHFLNAVGG